MAPSGAKPREEVRVMIVMIFLVSFVSLAIVVYLVMAEHAALNEPEFQPEERPMPRQQWRRTSHGKLEQSHSL